MTDSSPHLYRRIGEARGVPEEVLRRAAAQIAETEAHGAAAILSLGHLAHLSGTTQLYLRRIVQRVTDPYTPLPRTKADGGVRAILAPDPLLMEVQRVILRRGLTGLDLHPACFAYRRGRSAVDCARRHVGARYLVKLDIHNFFPSITEKRVYEVFRSRGYSKLVSLELARLCTQAPVSYRRTELRRYPTIESYAVDSWGLLPQGAPTSGALANAVATPLDYRISRIARSEGLVYTRYSDDLVLSGGGRFDRQEAARVVRRVRAAVSECGFTLHHNKTRVIPPRARHIVLGLLVDQTEVRLLPEFRRRVEVHVRGTRKFGLAEHAASRRFRSIFSFVNHVDGCLAFASDVQPEWATTTRGEWREALALSDFPLDPEPRSNGTPPPRSPSSEEQG